MAIMFFMLAGWGAGSPGVRPHPNSFSTSELHIRGSRIELQLRVQVLSLGEVIEGFDDNGDGHAEDGEIEASYGAISAYIAEHYRVSPRASTSAEAALSDKALVGKCLQIVEGPMALDPMNEVSEWIDVRFEFDAGEEEFRTVGAYVDLFEVTSPGHSDSCAVVWNGLELGAWMFAQDAESHVFEATEEMIARNAPAWRRFAVRGAKSLTGGGKGKWHAALLALLVVVIACRSRGSAVLSGVVLVAAVAAGILVTPEVPVRDQYLKFAQVTTSLALVYLALDYLIYRSGRTRILEPLVFGAILGFREATLARPELTLELDPVGEPLRGLALGLSGSLLALVLIVALTLKGKSALDQADGDEAAAEPYAPALVAALVSIIALGLGASSAFGILFP